VTPKGVERCRTARFHRGLAVVAVAVATALSGCDLNCDDTRDGVSGAREDDPVRLDVLVYNIEYGGGPETDKVIRRLDADVVGVLESYARLPEIARKTGYPHYNTSLQVLSKYPILEPSGADGLYSLIEVEPGYVVPFVNVHLDYVKWGPRALENGVSVEQVIATEERVRSSSMDAPVAAMTELIGDGYPVFLTGDFNQPSSLDYTAETVGTRKGVDEPIPWPISEELLELGFRDTYREEHPDPVEEPGITQNRTGERIDYIYAAGPATTVDSELVGEPGGEDVDIEAAPWISDHRAVLSTFDVRPMEMPELIAVDARLRTVGDLIAITWNAPGANGGEIGVVPEGGDPAEAVATLNAPDDRGTTTLDTAGWGPGTYEAVLVDGNDTEVARISFDLRDPQAELVLGTDKRTYARGEPIEVSWSRGPANRWDWLGVYKASAADPENDDFPVWAYVDGHDAGTAPPATEGEAVLGKDSQGTTWPLPPGDYVVHYLLADQYESAGSAEFTVRRGG
jgi:endonuclease/exonuclease/phosphatase family metal-dependent hydrolase